MLKHREQSDPNSCLNKAGVDEPIFVLRAKDPCAVPTIMVWAELRARLAIESNSLNDAECAKIASAAVEALKFEDWRKANVSKTAA